MRSVLAAALPVAVGHLVIAADSLPQGVAWCAATLGVTRQALVLRGGPDRLRDLLPAQGVDVQSGAGPALRATPHTALGDLILENR